MPLHRLLLLFLVFGVFVAGLSGGVPPESIREEARRRHALLIKEGYNLTYGWSLGPEIEKQNLLLPLLVPESKNEHQFSFWFEAKEGEASVRLASEGGKPLIDWSGRKGEMVVSCRIPAGRYVLEIHSIKVVEGRAEFGVKGSLVQQCNLDQDRCQEVSASPSQGFHWPYLLFLPDAIKCRSLLVVPNNTGFAVENLDLLRANGTCEIQRTLQLAQRLGCAVLVPLFPRPFETGEGGNLYLHALSRASLLTQVESWKRVDLQLLGMVQSARARLEGMGVTTDPKIILSGFSASGSFVNRFAMLHPEAVLAVSCGSPGGWPMVPANAIGDERLDYPLGSSDLQAITGRVLNSDALRQVRWYFFLGDQDTNDATHYRDSFTKAEEDLVNRHFGATLPARWKHAEQLYARSGMHAQFALFPGVAHVVTLEIQEDIARFFERCLAGTRMAPQTSTK